jgi:uncharacterized membrane protein
MTAMKRYAILYLATALVMLPLDLLFLGFVAKGFFASQVGDMLGEVRFVPAVLFYLIYVGGIVVFVNALRGRPGNRRCCSVRCSGSSATRPSSSPPCRC